MKNKKIFYFLISIFVIIFLYFLFINNNKTMLSSKMEEKLELIEKSFKEEKIYFFILSERRKSWWNEFLPLASKTSPHLEGDAVDLWVLFSKDISRAVDVLEKLNTIYPDLSGGIGLYTRHKKWNHMVHVDVVRGSERWGYEGYPDFPKDYYK